MNGVFSRDDGYTIRTRIKPATGRTAGGAPMHGELNFVRRPSSHEFVCKYMDEIARMDKKSEVELARFAARVIATKIVSWDAKDSEGKIVPVSGEAVMAMHTNIFVRLRSIICYASEAGDEVEEIDESAENGASFLEELEKNLSAGSASGSNTQEPLKSAAPTALNTSTT